MNTEQRAALVEELAGVMAGLVEDDAALIQLVYTPEEYTSKVLMPIIDRLLAEHNIDAMLDAVHPETHVELILTNPGEWEASVWMPGLDWSYEEPTATGTGPTRTGAMNEESKPYIANELMAIAVQVGGPGPIEPERVLATYASPDNWIHVHAPGKDGNMRHYWAWSGPMIVGYALAEYAVRQAEQENE